MHAVCIPHLSECIEDSGCIRQSDTSQLDVLTCGDVSTALFTVLLDERCEASHLLRGQDAVGEAQSEHEATVCGIGDEERAGNREMWVDVGTRDADIREGQCKPPSTSRWASCVRFESDRPVLLTCSGFAASKLTQTCKFKCGTRVWYHITHFRRS